MEQGSQEWLEARCASLGASQIADALAKTKSGWGAGRKNMIAQMVVERLTGQPTESYINAAMQRGIDLEGKARDYYQFLTDSTVEQVGLVKHPTIDNSHASPDGLIGDEGLVEIKCPNSATHLEYLTSETLPQKYHLQMQWQMACADRKWCDFFSYDDRFPPPLDYVLFRVERDDEVVAQLEKDVAMFLAEVDKKVAELQQKLEAA